MTEIRLLGPVQVWADGVEVDIGPAKPRAVLAALAVATSQAVPIAVIADRVWGERPPGRPAATLYPYLTLLRNALRPAGVEIVRRAGGYVLDAGEATVDAVRFRQGLADARSGRAGVTALRATIALWRGTPLTGLDSAWVTQYREALTNDLLSAWLLLADRMDGSGELAGLADDLVRAVGDYPLAEPLAGYAIRALVQAGRRAEALHLYAELRDRLVGELGEEPGDDLRALHLTILRRDPELVTRPGPDRVVPRQLPSATRAFAGRSAELRALDDLLDTAAATPAVVISAIAGTAGIGKTALALHWAHRVADRFPDGQIFVNLHGFDPTGAPTTAEEALRACLEAIGVRPEKVPADLNGRAAMFRSLTAGRRLLVVLDNARDTEQVRPMLPATPGCVVLVTSRNQLAGLIAELAAQPITLDLLDTAAAEQLLTDRLGRDRVAAEPEAVAVLARQCANLPLALCVLAAHAGLMQGQSLAELARQLNDSGSRLDRLDTADPVTSVRAVFSWSYDARPDDEQRLFRLLGLHPGPDISAPVAASLAGVTVPEATRLLHRLRQASLLEERAPGRYSCHDLLRAYALEVVRAAEPDSERGCAVRRMLDHYLGTAYRATLAFKPNRDNLDLPAPGDGVQIEEYDDRAAALAWWATELPVIVSATQLASELGIDVHAWQLADLVAGYLDRQGRWRDAITLELLALAAAQRLGQPAARAVAHQGLGYFYSRIGEYASARGQLRQALELYRSSGSRVGIARAITFLGFLQAQRRRYKQALAYAKNAFAIYTAEDLRSLAAMTLASIGWYHVQLGHHDDAIATCRQALAVAEELGDLKTQGAACHTIGFASHRLRRCGEAIDWYRRALDHYGESGDRFFAATTHRHLGDVHADAGDEPAARAAWLLALKIFEDLDHSEAAPLRAKLAETG